VAFAVTNSYGTTKHYIFAKQVYFM
jgi:hypothetical protein